MKKLLLPLAIAAVFSACSTKKEEDKRDMLFLSDTSSLRSNVMSDTATITQAAPVPATPAVTYTAPKAKKATTYRKPVKTVTPTQEPTAPVATTNTPAPTNTGTTPAETGTAGTGTQGTVDNTTTVPAKKEGISKAAKGAVIGGVAGAAAGAILGKSGKGAVIGGVIGAAGGYILGRKKDKADGRVGN